VAAQPAGVTPRLVVKNTAGIAVTRPTIREKNKMNTNGVHSHPWQTVLDRLTWGLLALALAAGGCAQIPRVNDAGRNKIDTVVIDPNVPEPDGIYYLGPGSIIFFPGGLVGAVISQATGHWDETVVKPGTALYAHILNSHIDVSAIALEETKDELRSWGKWQVLDAPPPPAPNVGTLKITVARYGFSIPNGFSSRLVPIVTLKYDLIDSTGKVVWSENDYTHPLGNPVEGLMPEEMRDNPKSIETALRGASRYISKKLLTIYTDGR
jgi:hypothetical protein